MSPDAEERAEELAELGKRRAPPKPKVMKVIAPGVRLKETTGEEVEGVKESVQCRVCLAENKVPQGQNSFVCKVCKAENFIA